MENITFASFIERSVRSRTRFERDSQSGPAFQKFSPMGTRIRFHGWVPYQGLGTPLFLLPGTSMRATVINHTRGPGPARLNSGYGKRKRSISFGVPLGKGMGCFWRAGRGPEWNAPTRRAAVNSGNSRTGTSSTMDQPCRNLVVTLRMQDGVRSTSRR